ncbi:MAG TPA: hydratase [Candidatus Gallimonas intestinigallinarum]|uniref:Hydratase n=1 Tax=Candidatus Gallimonas intestinigallinarum TaxID=2838604 RepID=A0A9D2IV27_9FIRM|nr:hydratase [Candidatus Gallimonas intestinigallinarum]
MVKLIKQGVYYMDGRIVKESQAFFTQDKKEEAVKNTLSYAILKAHNAGDEENLKIRFDAIASHDITYVGIIQTAKASGLTSFSLPYTLTNCHNSLCAVGGTINEDDHVFGLSAAQKYGGDYVPAHLAVIHQYMRECAAKCGAMILGSDSHTRYGALGTMAVGEGGPELVKQLLKQTYDVKRPPVIAVYLKGKLRKGVGPQDVAIALVKATFASGFVKNKILEFVGPGIANLSMDYRIGIDVMTTETTCLSSIWETDEKTHEYFAIHGREGDYKELKVTQPAYYDGAVTIDLSRVEPMIALPFHPSNAYTIREFLANPVEILKKVEEQGRKIKGDDSFTLTDKVRDGKVYVDQGVIAGCAGGGYENVAEAAEILRGGSVGTGAFALSVYPASQPVYKALTEGGYVSTLFDAGVIVKTAFCGPCFGAGDVPANNALSIRHTTRNFENREGSKPAQGQLAAVELMDARSIAATAANGGVLTSALDYNYNKRIRKYRFDGKIYENRVYHGVGNPDPAAQLVYGPNIADWPEQIALGKNLLMKVVSVLKDPVTTTDELIPSGETSSYRSNPMKLAEFALSRKDPGYVARAKAVMAEEKARRETGALPEEVSKDLGGFVPGEGTIYGSVVVSNKPGDGSAREQAASCQRVLGGVANICIEYATKRYRSNLINWGMLPFTTKKIDLKMGDYLYIPNIADAVATGEERVVAKVISGGKTHDIALELGTLTAEERKILLAGCLINYNKGNL